MKRSTLLFVAAAVVLAAGLSGPLLRKASAPADPVKALEARRAGEQTALRAELARERDSVIATMRDRLMRGDAQGAMAAGARYHELEDADVNALYTEAAARVSFLQRVDEVRRLVAEKCTPLSARIGATRFLRTFSGADESANFDRLTLARLADAEARAPIVAILATPRDGKPRGDDPLSRSHAAHRARLHTHDAAALQLEPLPENYVCAWRMTGPLPVGGRQRNVTLDFWLAPMPVGQALDFEALRYEAR